MSRTDIKKSIIILTLILSVGCIGCSNNMVEEKNIVLTTQEQEEKGYSLAVVTVDDVVQTQNFKCVYRQLRDQKVSFLESGKIITDIYVKEGESVVAGQLLAQLSTGQNQDEIEALEYQIARTKLLMEHSVNNENVEISGKWVVYLYQSGKTQADKEVLDAAIEAIQRNHRYLQEDYQDTIDIAQMKLDKLKSEEEKSAVYASMNGVVTGLKGELEGTTSKAEEVIMTIIDDTLCMFESDNIEVAATMLENTEMTLNIISGIGAGKYTIVPYEKEEWKEVMYFAIEESPNTMIEVGASGTAAFVSDSRSQVLTVPLKAVHSADGAAYVYVEGDSGIREVKWIETGLYGDTNVEVIAGLLEGEKVILK